MAAMSGLLIHRHWKGHRTMRTTLFGTVAAAALALGGAAWAQSSDPTTTPPVGSPGQTTPAPTDTQALPEGVTIVEPGAATADRTSLEQLIGRTALGGDGEELGEIEDVILDADTGEAEQLVLKTGGFLGLGGKSVAIDMAEAQVQPGGEEIRISSITREQLEALPEYEYTDTTVSLSQAEKVETEAQTTGR